MREVFSVSTASLAAGAVGTPVVLARVLVAARATCPSAVARELVVVAVATAPTSAALVGFVVAPVVATALVSASAAFAGFVVASVVASVAVVVGTVEVADCLLARTRVAAHVACPSVIARGVVVVATAARAARTSGPGLRARMRTWFEAKS